MTSHPTRRQSITRTTAGAAGRWIAAPQILRAQSGLSAIDRLNIGFIGPAGQAGFSIGNCKGWRF